jgi:hypothetical protein
VIGIVQTNGNELAHIGHGATHAGLAFDQGQLVGFEFGQLGQDFVGQLVGANVGHHTAQVAQLASRINETWFFFAGLAVSNEFHKEILGLKIRERKFVTGCFAQGRL